MPYQIPDPSAPIFVKPEGIPAPALTPEEADAHREITSGEAFDALKALIGELAGPVEAARQRANEAARAKVATTPEFVQLRSGGLLLRDAAIAYTDAHYAAARNTSLSPEGRETKDAEERVKLDARLNGIASRVLSGHGDGLLRQFPPVPALLIPDRLAPTVSAIFAGADHHLPEALIGRAVEALRLATDPTTDTGARADANVVLDAAFLPLLTRYAAAPPRHWQKWAPLAHRLGELTRVHLDTVFNRRGMHRVAVQAVEAFRREYTYLVGMLRSHNYEWDDMYAIGAPAFDWSGLSKVA